jgi:hypothetical protein
MTIHNLSAEHEWVKFPAFYNAYPLRNEVSGAGIDPKSGTPAAFGDVFIDDYYGRIFDQETKSIGSKYGRTNRLRHYVSISSLPIIDELRVPYRRIPIYATGDASLIEQAVTEMRAGNGNYRILLRGQTRTYLLQRPEEESLHFYGEAAVKEPSFLPSHLRHKFDPYFLKCMWQSQAAILLNDLGHEMEEPKPFHAMATRFRNSGLFIPFALGIAQHYGLPSVGLDLTDSLEVAAWFATHTITGSPSGRAVSAMIDFSGELEPTVFVFRCPPDAVFEYGATKPTELPNGRPDAQAAWFGHVGWGAASNQLGSYLMCGFRLTKEFESFLDPALDDRLFPQASDDPMLKHFLTMKGFDKYEGEARRALGGIYYLRDD